MSGKNKIKQPVVSKKPDISIKKQHNNLWPVLIISIIVFITYVSFSPSLKNDFVNWDDQEYVTTNPLVVSETIPLKKIFTTPVSNHYHPLTILTLAWNYQTGELSPKVYHATNLILHLMNTILVFIFIYLLTKKNIFISGIVSFFFGIHPMHVESVAWISERKDMMYSLFFLAGLVTYLRYTESKKTAWYIVTLLLFIFSCLSKVMAVVFPVILIVVDYYMGINNSKYQQGAKSTVTGEMILLARRIFASEKIPFFILSLAFVLIGYIIQLKGTAPGFRDFPFVSRIMFGCYGAIMYPVKFFAPVMLSPFYPFPAGNVVSSMILYPIILLSAIALIYFFLRKEKPIIFGLLFYFVSVVIVLQFITGGPVIMADRYAYISSIGLLFPIAFYINKLWEKKSTSLTFLKYPSLVVLIITGIAFCFQSYARSQVWKNGETLWSDAINKYPFYISYSNRAEYYQEINDDDKAINDYSSSIQLNPYYSEARNNRGMIYYKRGRYDLALADYEQAIRYNNDINQASSYFANRALALMKMGENEKAEKDFAMAFEQNAKATESNMKRLLINRGFFYDYTKQFEKAISDYTNYLNFNPEDDLIYNARGMSHINLGHINESYSDFSKAIELNPTIPNYWLNRSIAENSLGRKTEAKADAEKALSLGMKVGDDYLRAVGIIN